MEQWPEEFDEDGYGYDDGEPDECYHEDYESDILTGRAWCMRCNHTWWQTPAEIEREIEHIREYDAWQVEECRREHWYWRAWFAVRDWFRP